MGYALRDRGLPQELADRKQAFETKEELAGFERLSGILQADMESAVVGQGPRQWRRWPVETRLRFGWADARRQYPALGGRVEARIPAICQRCLEPFELPIELTLRLRLVASGATTEEQDGYEDWELHEQTVRPLDIVEEALIMALPMAPLHDDANAKCRGAWQQAEARASGTLRPFADLRARMKDTE